MSAGRPLKFATPEDMQVLIDKYFAECEIKELPLTITGLALALDTSRETLCNYENRDEFFYTIKRAKQRVENFAEMRLYAGQPTGAIFALKNFGWRDKSEHDHTTNGKEIRGVLVGFVDPENKPTEEA